MFSGGYIAVKADGHPMAWVQNKKYALEHRLVASQMLGRPLGSKEVVHHINGNRADNRPENLMVCSQAEHMRAHYQKLSDEQARAIRERWRNGEKATTLAKEFAVSLAVIYRAKNRCLPTG